MSDELPWTSTALEENETDAEIGADMLCSVVNVRLA